MKPSYKDIYTRIKDGPLWYDQNGCPRYEQFHPRMLDIYCEESVLMLIGCQACDTEFKVAIPFSHTTLHGKYFSERVINGDNIYYGDPPDIECCPAGPTMSSNSKQILEFWKKENFVWIRVPELEKTFEEKDW